MSPRRSWPTPMPASIFLQEPRIIMRARRDSQRTYAARRRRMRRRRSRREDRLREITVISISKSISEQDSYMLGGKQNEWTKDIERRSETKQVFRKRRAERYARTYSVREATYAYRRVGIHNSSYRAVRAYREVTRHSPQRITCSGRTISSANAWNTGRARRSARRSRRHDRRTWTKWRGTS